MINTYLDFMCLFMICCRKDELDSICTMIPSLDMKKVLQEGTSMATNVMYYYFEILRDGCDTYFIADPIVCVSTLL